MVRFPALRSRPARRGSLYAGVVQRTEVLTPSMVRIVVSGPGLAAFPSPEHTDAYVKVVFPRPGVTYPLPLDLDRIKAEMPAEQWPQQRTYTVRAWNAQARELTLDFVVHGDEGVAGPWARAAVPGDQVYFLGPGGGYAPDPAADWHLLAGDESALPAIAVALERLSSTASGHAVIEVHGPDDELPLAAPDGVSLTWVHRGGRPRGQQLVQAVSALEFLPGKVHAFVHGEAGFVRELRRLLRIERGLAQSQLSISGYWRLGADDEGWRADKREWNQAIEAAETAAGLT